MDCWRILVVDDEDDIHLVTTMALKGKRWRSRPFRITSAHSAEEARQILTNEQGAFQVALVDVVMETATAGLDLCRFIRSNCPRSLRIVLRTGQPGVAPEEKILNECDIDYYLAKNDATAVRLFGTVRACLRSSLDIQTLINLQKQMQHFAEAVTAESVESLLKQMGMPLNLLKEKHGVPALFLPNTEASQFYSSLPALTPAGAAELVRAVKEGHANLLGRSRLLEGEQLGLPGTHWVFLFSTPGDEAEHAVQGGVVLVSQTSLSSVETDDLGHDVSLVVENWSIAYRAFRLQQQVLQDRMLRENMYQERTQRIAMAVGSVAHDLGTPIGVANTAAQMIGSTLKEVAPKLRALPELEEQVSEMAECADLVEKNLERANTLIKSFTKVTSSQATDQRQRVNLLAVIKDCVEAMRPETKRKKLAVVLHALVDQDYAWDGFPGHLSQVIVNFFQNAIRYAYDVGVPGNIDIRVEATPEISGGGFRIEFEDHGKGVAPHVLARLFTPFVTTGGIGLGLPICRNIVTKMLKGTIRCESQPGVGTKFIIEIPRVAEATSSITEVLAPAAEHAR